MITWTIIAIILISTLSKNLWPYFYSEMYFQGAAIAWVLACGLLVNQLKETIWPRKWALILFWWAVCDVVEMFAMNRTAFDWNEYITASITVLILICGPNGRRKKRTGRLERTGYK